MARVVAERDVARDTRERDKRRTSSELGTGYVGSSDVRELAVKGQAANLIAARDG